jgi:hypothetical protein
MVKPLAAACLILLASGVARADDKEAARQAYIEGTRLYDLADFNAALQSFKKAYLNYEEPAFLFNIAQCHRALGDKGEAIRFYRTYLRKVPNAANHVEVEKIIANLEAAQASDRASRAQAPQGMLQPPANARPESGAARPEMARVVEPRTAPPPTAPPVRVAPPPIAPPPSARVEPPVRAVPPAIVRVEPPVARVAPPVTARVEPPPVRVGPPPGVRVEPPVGVRVELPPVRVVPAPVAVTPAVAVAPLEPGRPPIYRRWWFWTIIGGAVVLAVGIGIGVSLASTPARFAPTLGDIGPAAHALTVRF